VQEEVTTAAPQPRSKSLLESATWTTEIHCPAPGNGVDFLFGLAKNERLIAEIKTELDVVAAKSRHTGRMERRFKSFMWMTRRKDSHDIATLAEKFDPSTSHVEWIGRLSREGQWAVISGDRRITKNCAEYHAFRNSNLIGLFLAQGLYKAPVVKQMERILALWPNIVTVCQTVQGGAMFELPLKRTLLRQLKFRISNASPLTTIRWPAASTSRPS
jgi:hypothetical protein